MTAPSLEERFRAVVDEIERPTTDLVGPVLAAIDGGGSAPVVRGTVATRLRLRRRSAWVWIAVAVAAFVLAAAVVLAPARQSVARWLGIGATRVVVESGEGGDDTGPAASGDGRETTSAPAAPLPSARRDVIASLGPPSEIADGPGRSRTYRWPATDDLPALGGTRMGVQLTARPAEGEVVTKRVEPGVELVFVDIPGRPDPVLALWIGAAHQREAPGGVPELAQQVLVWVDGDVEYRLEVDAGLETALALAAEIERGTDLLAPE